MTPAVWAPIPRHVRLWTEGAVHPMTADEGGWWRSDVELAPGTRYGFLLDDDPTPLPDPRGRALPDGVDGPSQVVDPALFAEPDAGWAGRELRGCVIYELHLGTFTPDGTLDSAIERLDHLVGLGVDLVEPLPVNAFEGHWNWGYDGVAWYAVDPAYGGPAAYRRFVAACHARGLGVIQDVVYNHLGPSGNYLPRFGPYLTSESGNTWGDAVNLDEPEVREYVLDNARMWLEDFGVDGLRLDAVHALLEHRRDALLRELSTRTDALSTRLGRPLTLIAESDLNDPVIIRPRDDGGDGITAQWSDDYHHAVHVALTSETTGYYADFDSLDALAKVATRGFFHDGGYSSFREREHGAPIPPELETWRLVTFSQDHDQVGNRAAGDRLSQTLSPDRLAIAAVLTICSPFTPMIFMGEEWGASTPWQFFTAHEDPQLGEATAEGRIAEFTRMGWDRDAVPDPQDPGTFRRSHLDWSEPDREPHRRLLHLYRALIELRRREPDLRPDDFATLSAEVDDDAGHFLLRLGGIEVLANLGDAEWLPPASGELLLGTRDGVTAAVLPADSAAIRRSR